MLTFDQLKKANFKSPTVVLLYSGACTPCEFLKPKLRAICKDEGVRLEEFNSASEMPAIRELGLRSTPAVLLVMPTGAVKTVFFGDLSLAEIKDKLRDAGVRIR